MVVIPSVDVRGGRVAFRSGTAADVPPEELAARFVAQGAEELHLVDLDEAERGEPANAALLTRIARGCGVPCRLAGGIASLERARAALADGFAGVLFSSAVFGDETLLPRIAALGERAIVEIEADGSSLAPRGGGDLARRAAGRDAIAAVLAAAAAGVRALYVIEVGADGRLGGPPLALLRRVRDAIGAHEPLAVHAGGGVRDLGDVVALARGGARSVVVGRALADGRFTLAEAHEAARRAA